MKISQDRESIKKYHRNILDISKKPVPESSIVWSGRPSFSPYMIANKSFLRDLIGVLVILIYEKFQIGIFSKIALGVWAVELIYHIISWSILTYYITAEGPVVKRGSKYFRLYWRDIRADEYKVFGRPVEALLGCKTFEFTRCYISSKKHDAWREKARFWCIKEHTHVEHIISKYMNY